ncbi:MAG TPA: hypothetical protein VF032_17085 [Thermoleophilaceae bacterium]
MPPDQPSSNSVANAKPYAMYVVVVGLVAVVAVAIPAIFHYKSAADVVTVLAPVTGVIGALVGAYFGIRGATLAQQQANEGLAQIHAKTITPVAPQTDGGQQTPTALT